MNNIFRELLPFTAVPKTDIEHWVVSGQLDYVRGVQKFGYNLALSNVAEDIHSIGGTLSHLTAAATLELISSDANDTISGTGARKVKIFGIIDVAGVWTYAEEEFDMNGTSATSASSNSWLRVYRMRVTERGTYGGTGANAGTITCRVEGAGATLCEIPVDADFGGCGTSYTTHYSTAYNEHLFIYWVIVNKESGKTVDLSVRIRTNANDVTTPFTGGYFNQITHRDIPTFMQWDTQKIPFYVPPNSDFWFRGVAGQSALVSINYAGLVFTHPEVNN